MALRTTKELAEFVGVLLGDGSINVYNPFSPTPYYRVKMTFNSKESDYIDYVSNLIQFIFNENPLIKKRENENTMDILIFKRRIILQILNIGLKASPKWGRAEVPGVFMNRQLGKYVLRGYFDTDGCLVCANNNGTLYLRLEMKISPSPMLHQFKQQNSTNLLIGGKVESVCSKITGYWWNSEMSKIAVHKLQSHATGLRPVVFDIFVGFIQLSFWLLCHRQRQSENTDEWDKGDDEMAQCDRFFQHPTY